MDNRALADFIRTELSKVTSAISKLAVKISALADNPREQKPETIAPKQTAADKAEDSKARVPIVSPAPANPREPNRGTRPRFPRRTFRRRVWRQFKRIFCKKDRWERIGIAFGIAYAITTILQWHDLRSNFAAEQRAWIKVDWGFATKLDPLMPVVVYLHNVGKSVALRIQGGVIVQVVDADKSPSFPLGTTVTIRRTFINTMFPSESTSFDSGRTPNNPDGTIRPLEAEELRKLASGEAYLATFGIIAYRDQFGDHWTRFCTWKGFQSGMRDFHTGSCLDWNQVGEGITKWDGPGP
jgi:hypothetical protein